LNSRRIKRSRASEQSDQAIKDDFHRSRFLIPVANASTADVYVTTPCNTCHAHPLLWCARAVCALARGKDAHAYS